MELGFGTKKSSWNLDRTKTKLMGLGRKYKTKQAEL